MPTKIGVLALQGDFREHVAVLKTLGVDLREIRLPAQLDDVDGIVIPGGESTTIVQLMDAYGFRSALPDAVRRGLAVWGTCAGMIAIAHELTDPYPKPLDLIDIKVSRNWFGRQVDSFEIDLDFRGLQDGPFHGVFIRAPIVTSIGPRVETLAKLDDVAVAVRSGRIMATAFHPELTDDTRVHRLFVEIAESKHTGEV